MPKDCINFNLVLRLINPLVFCNVEYELACMSWWVVVVDLDLVSFFTHNLNLENVSERQQRNSKKLKLK